jgi:hypothetical protein
MTSFKALVSIILIIVSSMFLIGARPPNYCDKNPTHPWCVLPTLTPTPTPVVTPTPSPTPATTGVNLADYGGNWANAIAAAETRGKVVNVPAGTWPAYRIFASYSGLTIRGAGATSIVPRNASQPCCDVGGFIHVTATNVTIEGITLRGWTSSSDDIMINGRDAAGLVVRNVRIENAKGIGIQLQGANMRNALIEDVTILNTTYRSNGYHGVGFWLYNGASDNVIRRLTVDGADYAGVFLDAGTESGPALTTDRNTFEDVVVRNVSRVRLPSSAFGAGIMLTGASFNTFTRWTATDVPFGPGIALGWDQSGIGSNDNRFTTGNVARIASQDVISFGGQVRNVVDGGTGTGYVRGLTGNSVINWPELTPR